MDYQNRAGNKGAGVAGASEANVDRRERLRKLALETIDIAKDPYILRNHLGSLECRLCLTLHTNEGSYLAHTQGKKHQTNLARRAAREAKEHELDSRFSSSSNQQLLIGGPSSSIDNVPKKSFVKIGRPGYRITKVREPVLQNSNGVTGVEAKVGGRMGLLFQINLPEIKNGVKPVHRFMSSFEQKVEPQNRAWQYLVVAAEPYETISFKLQSREIDRSATGLIINSNSLENGRKLGREEPTTWSWWDVDQKNYTIQVLFR